MEPYIPLDDTRGVPLHSSHVIIESWDTPDPHCPAWQCTVCREYQCVLCNMKTDDPLAQPCSGREWWLV